jgi:hypothetical protein
LIAGVGKAKYPTPKATSGCCKTERIGFPAKGRNLVWKGNKMATKQKYYTISTMMCGSLKEAEEKIEAWIEADTLKHNTKVFEITEIYEPKIKLEKVK